MIASLMVFGLVTGVLAAILGRAVEAAAALTGLPRRWGWAAVLALTAALVAAAPIRSAAKVPGGGSAVAEAAELAATQQAGTRAPGVTTPLALARAWLDALLVRAARADAAVGTGVLGGLWLALTLVVIGAGVGLLARSSRARRCLPSVSVEGERVRIAAAWGPAVAGLVRPEIVVPRWLLAAPASEQRMAIAHEREHVRAGDPHLLAFGYVVVALMPWNPAVWWLHRRLQLAVELDCDRRVLRRGIARRSYGSFLIHAAALGGARRVPGVVTLAASKPALERRLEAMTATTPRHPILRATLLLALGSFALLAACEAKLPTDAEIEQMNATDAAARVQALGASADVVAWSVDGKAASAEEAKSIPADAIARIEVVRAADGDRMLVWTRAAESSSGEALRVERRLQPARQDATAQLGDGFTGLLVIDGKVVDRSRLRDLEPGRIERIEVLKGAAAQEQYSDPAAANGVIIVTTKR